MVKHGNDPASHDFTTAQSGILSCGVWIYSSFPPARLQVVAQSTGGSGVLCWISDHQCGVQKPISFFGIWNTSLKKRLFEWTNFLCRPSFHFGSVLCCMETARAAYRLIISMYSIFCYSKRAKNLVALAQLHDQNERVSTLPHESILSSPFANSPSTASSPALGCK